VRRNTILTLLQLWDVCSDQEAVDLIRNIQDPQVASKALVDHALARFSTDNLSCMVVRFDNKAVQQTVDKVVEPIGVEGDPATRAGGITESEAIVRQQENRLNATGEKLDSVPSRELMEADEGPEAPAPATVLKPEAAEAARKDRAPQTGSEAAS
jgi:protein phosphatase PTC1